LKLDGDEPKLHRTRQQSEIQASNCFINAREQLCKHVVEEMYQQELAIKGDVDVHSIFATSLPTSHPSFAPLRVWGLAMSTLGFC
ncbi:hypothetical protein SSX86_033020, partial [Deinandra increscens subsp. villosa]